MVSLFLFLFLFLFLTKGKTALEWFAVRGDVEMVKMMLSKGASCDGYQNWHIGNNPGYQNWLIRNNPGSEMRNVLRRWRR